MGSGQRPQEKDFDANYLFEKKKIAFDPRLGNHYLRRVWCVANSSCECKRDAVGEPRRGAGRSSNWAPQRLRTFVKWSRILLGYE